MNEANYSLSFRLACIYHRLLAHNSQGNEMLAPRTHKAPCWTLDCSIVMGDSDKTWKCDLFSSAKASVELQSQSLPAYGAMVDSDGGNLARLLSSQIKPN